MTSSRQLQLMYVCQTQRSCHTWQPMTTMPIIYFVSCNSPDQAKLKGNWNVNEFSTLPCKMFLVWLYNDTNNTITRDYYRRALNILDTIGNCQRTVVSLGVTQHVHKIINLWKYELNWWSKLQANYDNKRKKHPCHTKLCATRCLISELVVRSRNQVRGKLLLSQKSCNFRRSRFSQCFIL